MAATHYSFSDECVIELCEGVETSYREILLSELKDAGFLEMTIEEHIIKMFEEDPTHQAALWEMTVAARFFDISVVIIVEYPRNNWQGEECLVVRAQLVDHAGMFSHLKGSEETSDANWAVRRRFMWKLAEDIVEETRTTWLP